MIWRLRADADECCSKLDAPRQSTQSLPLAGIALLIGLNLRQQTPMTAGRDINSIAIRKPRIGCAGWAIPTTAAAIFPSEGTHLERYARVFNAVEINSSFYRPHQAKTYRKWATSVPAPFRFSAKMPRTISHVKRLNECMADVETFLEQVGHMGTSLGCLLLQLPPSLIFDEKKVARFFEHYNRCAAPPLVCEPRHASWFSPEASGVLAEFGVSRAGADPAKFAGAQTPTGSAGYWRLHGSPHMYYDSYSPSALRDVKNAMDVRRKASQEPWCIFDNTAAGHAVPNALALMRSFNEQCVLPK